MSMSDNEMWASMCRLVCTLMLRLMVTGAIWSVTLRLIDWAGS